MGPSGSGKSTLLRLLNFLEPPTEGTIRFLGKAIQGNGGPPLDLRRKVTMVFQSPVLLSGTVQENVAYGLRLRKEKATDGRVEEILRWVGLEELAPAPARTLSGGERQRVALARAMVIEPEVLLLDEPTANLDPYNVGLMEEIITDIKEQRGTTIVLVTHNVFQARRLSDRVAFILGGRIIEVGKTERVFTQPHDPRTAAFVQGEMVY
ncbi:MAG: phosphate ABC transporter ATP-binding protein, partial [Anaerolineae bacterium]